MQVCTYYNVYNINFRPQMTLVVRCNHSVHHFGGAKGATAYWQKVSTLLSLHSGKNHAYVCIHVCISISIIFAYCRKIFQPNVLYYTHMHAYIHTCTGTYSRPLPDLYLIGTNLK